MRRVDAVHGLAGGERPMDFFQGFAPFDPAAVHVKRRHAVAPSNLIAPGPSIFRQYLGLHIEAHLVEKPRGHRGTQQRHAVDIGRVEAGGQDVDVDQELQIAVLEPLERVGPIEGQRLAADEPAFMAHLVKDSLNVQGVLYTGREDQHRMAVPGVLDDLAACRSHERVLVHEGLDFAGDILAAAHVQARGVDLAPARLGLQRTKISLDDQLANADFVADAVEQVVRPANHAGGHAVRGGSQADQPYVGIDFLRVGQECAVHPLAFRREHVTFIQKDDVEAVEFLCPAVDALNARDDDRMVGIAAAQTGRVDADLVPEVRCHGVKLIDRLFEQLLDVRQDQHAPGPLGHRVAADRRHDGRLAPGRRDDDARIVIPTAQVVVNSLDGFGLVRTQRDRRRFRRWKERLNQALASSGRGKISCFVGISRVIGSPLRKAARARWVLA